MAIERIIDVNKQQKLSLRKCLSLVMSGIAHRLLRSTLTMAVILLAVAFFMAMLSEATFINSTNKTVNAAITKYRESATFLNYIYSKPSETLIAQELAKIYRKRDAIEERAKVTGIPADQIESLALRCMWVNKYINFFNSIDDFERTRLVKRHTGSEIFRYLAGEKEWAAFLSALDPFRNLKLPSDRETLRSLASGYETFVKDLSSYTAKWYAAVDKLESESSALTGGEKINLWLVKSDPKAVEKWRALVNNTGFRLESEKLERICLQLKDYNLRDEITALLNTPEKKESWKKAFQQRMKMDEKLNLLTDPRTVKILDEKYSMEQLTFISRMIKKDQLLNKLDKLLSGRKGDETDSFLSGRQVFLLIISFIVCMVGIANAMLMSITERFREIATMKCLGATDGYILTQFMLEAMMQGMAGGLLGMCIGLLLAVIKNGLQLGTYMFADIPVANLGLCAFLSVMIGIVLAAIASLYPSWAASRMAPMEAMRIE
ncbi:MAG: ABC transporter permease [Planctomycetes bacterium]|nr:ABC transporter permease [Planctomycetota bacterium]